jgi:hypothetical protein
LYKLNLIIGPIYNIDVITKALSFAPKIPSLQLLREHFRPKETESAALFDKLLSNSIVECVVPTFSIQQRASPSSLSRTPQPVTRSIEPVNALPINSNEINLNENQELNENGPPNHLNPSKRRKMDISSRKNIKQQTNSSKLLTICDLVIVVQAEMLRTDDTVIVHHLNNGDRNWYSTQGLPIFNCLNNHFNGDHSSFLARFNGSTTFTPTTYGQQICRGCGEICGV